MAESPEAADPIKSYRLNQMFEILKHPFRRRVLLRLSEHTPRSEAELTAGALTTSEDEPDVLTIQLRHHHFPKLADTGYIEWDQSTDTIDRGPKFDEIKPLLKLVREYQDEFPEMGH
ncbi:ArsR family transcriptional regulator [Natronomonas sp.]|uniref:DUF7344 domain-containing protein n=1 Tax=Natronomonas sp. TaxID=2184060 RepID=UPI003976B35C